MAKEALHLEAKTIRELFGIVKPNLTPTQRQQFIGLTRSWAAQRKTIGNLETEANQLLAPFTEDMEYGESLLEDIEMRFNRTREFIYSPKFRWYKGRFSAQIGKIKVALGISQIHPWLMPISEERQNASEFLLNTGARKRLAEKDIQDTFQPQIEQGRVTLGRIETRLFSYVEDAVIPSLDSIKRYIQALPQKTEELIEKYGKVFCLDPNRLVNSDRFIQLIEPYIERRAKRGNSFQIVKEQIQRGNGLPYSQLPEEVKHRLQIWLSYQLSLTLYKDGLIPEPPLPDIFRNIKL